MKNCLFICMSGSSSYSFFRGHGCAVAEPYKYKSRLAYRMRYICHLIKLESLSVLYKLDDAIMHIEPELIIIEGTLIYEPFLNKLRHRHPTVPIRYYYSNIVKDRASVSPEILRKYRVDGYSWDKDDCNHHSLIYSKPCFDIRLLPETSQIKYDACFIGADKGRYKIVLNLQKEIEKIGLRCFVLLTPDYKFLKFLKPKYSNSISYENYLDIVSKSRCLIDIVQKGQTGTTMRVMEALFSNKKIISNNLHLVEYDFYNENNIFILGKDNIDKLQRFFNSSYEPIDRSILEEYKTTTWLNKVLET